MMRGRDGSAGLGDEDLDVLQHCFDQVVYESRLERKSEAANEIAKALFAAYRRGVHDKDALIALVRLHSE